MNRTEGGAVGTSATGSDAETDCYNTAVPARPVVVTAAGTVHDVVTAVRHAAESGSPVGVRATGHGPSVPMDDAVLVVTRRMRGVHVDPVARTAVVEAGTLWRDVLDAAAEHGLAPLSGSNPGVGVVGYTTGGGLGPLGRRYGYAADHVRSLQIVTADGVLRHAAPDDEADLFWGVRGAKDNLGIVVRMEIALVPVPGILGGGLYFSASRSEQALRAYLVWTADQPDEMSSSVQLIRYPDAPGVPDRFRGHHVTHVRVAWSGDEDEGERRLTPLRALGPDLGDTVGPMRFRESGSIHHEPPGPVRVYDRNTALDGAAPGLADVLLDLAGPDSGATLFTELRHHGGAYSRPPEVANAVGGRDAEFLLLSTSVIGRDGVPPLREQHDQLHRRLGTWSTGGSWVNFFGVDDTAADRVATAYDPKDLRRIADLKAAYDPDNLFRVNYNIGPVAAR